LVHELQVHQIELEMQNGELEEAREKMEALLEDYTDRYDFAPVGYMSLNEQGQILKVNLTGAALLGVGRSHLINRPLSTYVEPASRPIFLAFLKQVFAGSGKHVCEAALLRERGASFWANIHGAVAISTGGPQKWCRVVVSDITALKLLEEAQRRVEALADDHAAEFQSQLLRHSTWPAGQKSLRKDVKNPKNHFRPFCSGNLLSAKPFQPESHKTIFRIFRKIFEGTRGRGSPISSVHSERRGKFFFLSARICVICGQKS
jgi:PAS domain S-box-containing protein